MHGRSLYFSDASCNCCDTLLLGLRSNPRNQISRFINNCLTNQFPWIHSRVPGNVNSIFIWWMQCNVCVRQDVKYLIGKVTLCQGTVTIATVIFICNMQMYLFRYNPIAASWPLVCTSLVSCSSVFMFCLPQVNKQRQHIDTFRRATAVI